MSTGHDAVGKALKGERVMVTACRYHQDWHGAVVRVLGPEPSYPDSIRVEAPGGRRFAIQKWQLMPGPMIARCGERQPHYPEHACELAAGHGRFNLDGNVFGHAMPTAGAFWNVERAIQPHEVQARPADRWEWNGEDHATRVAQYPAKLRIGSTGYLETWVDDCTCDSPGGEFSHRPDCGWTPVLAMDLILKFARALTFMNDDGKSLEALLDFIIRMGERTEANR